MCPCAARHPSVAGCARCSGDARAELGWLLQSETLFVRASSSIRKLPISLLCSQQQTISFYLVFASHLNEKLETLWPETFWGFFPFLSSSATWNHLCFNILCLGTFMVLRKELQTLLEEIWFWSRCYEHFKIVCCSCTVHDVPCYSTHASVLWAALAAGIYFRARSGSHPWI